MSSEIGIRDRKIPGQTEIGATAAPVVYIPYNHLDQTDLLQKGSRVNYLQYFQFHPQVDTTGKWSQLVSLVDKNGFRLDDKEAVADTHLTLPKNIREK